jgi:uncharacterized protein (TIRG00374 family)
VTDQAAVVTPVAGPSRPRRAWLLSLAFSTALLVALYRSVDGRAVAAALAGSHTGWLILALGMIVPILMLRSLRFSWIVPPGSIAGFREALRLTLVASAFNIFLPTKSGDFVKSLFVAKSGAASGSVAVAVVVYDRLADMFGLLCWCFAGWLMAAPSLAVLPPVAWLTLAALGALCGVLVLSERAAFAVVTLVRSITPSRRLKVVHSLADGWPALHRGLRGSRGTIALFSIFLWLVQLTQVWLFTHALSITIPFTVLASLGAVALMAGQLPFTFAGIGARDVALVVLLAGYASPEAASAVGVLTALRVLLPPLAALPILRPYLATVVGTGREWIRS